MAMSKAELDEIFEKAKAAERLAHPRKTLVEFSGRIEEDETGRFVIFVRNGKEFGFRLQFDEIAEIENAMHEIDSLIKA